MLEFALGGLAEEQESPARTVNGSRPNLDPEGPEAWETSQQLALKAAEGFMRREGFDTQTFFAKSYINLGALSGTHCKQPLNPRLCAGLISCP